MSEANETHAAIVAEMRDGASYGTSRSATVEGWAGRLEAANKRELAERDSVIQSLNAELQKGQAKNEWLRRENVARLNLARRFRDKCTGKCYELKRLREAVVAMVDAETDGENTRDALCGRCIHKLNGICKHDGTCWVDKIMTAIAATETKVENQ